MTQPSTLRRRLVATGLAILSTLALHACGGGGSSSAPAPAPAPAAGTRALAADFYTRKAVAYSGYRGADRNTVPTSAEVLEDLQLLTQANFKLIRLFGSGDADSKVVLKTIADNHLDIKVQLGVWISGPKSTHDTENQAEITRGVALAKAYSDIVMAVSVGNETMVDWSALQVPADDMAAYIKQVRDQITQPVTTDDNWAFWANKDGKYGTDKITAVVDYVSLHTYSLLDSVYDPSFSWKMESTPEPQRAAAMMDAMINKAKTDYGAVKGYLTSKGLSLPIIIGETGWKAAGGEANRDHPVNQKMYYERLNAWTDGPKQIFYFEAFDEPWKGGDNGWGLWDVNRKARYVIYDLFPANMQDGGSYTSADALYYKPPTANPTITANTYVLFADTVPAGAAQPTGANTPLTSWQPWDSPPTASGAIIGTSTAEGANALEITPIPKSWGWGFFLNLANADDLSLFNAAGGYLNFSIKTTYAGKLEIGFFTGSAGANTGVDVYLPIAPGEYGYQNDGAWHTVSIPVTAIAAKAAPAFGQPQSAVLNMAQVTNGFVIADRYGVTGNTAGSTTKIQVDNIYWDHH
jgi:exo-beta-1,3-glucanase (GH17 family)